MELVRPIVMEQNRIASSIMKKGQRGTGLLILGGQYITAALAQGSLKVGEETYVIPKLTELVEACHHYGAK